MKRFLSLFACLVLSAGLAACGGETSTGENNTTGPACESHDDCSGEQRCSADGSCVEAGDGCSADTNCAGGVAYCSTADRTSTDGQCLGNWCAGDDDCPGHAVCNTATNSCRTGCRADDDCSGGWVCNEVTLSCEDPNPCYENPDCSAHKQCNTDGDINVCEYDGTCSRPIHCTGYANQLDDGEEYFCGDNGQCQQVPPCESDDECEPGEICVEGDCRGGCRDDSYCLLGEYCDLGDLNCKDGCNTNSDCENDGDICIDLQCEAGCPNGRDQCDDGLICTGDPAYCQPCTDDNQCYGVEFCDMTATDVEGTGWCTELPPECPEDAFGSNNSQAAAWDLVDDRPDASYGGEDFDYENFLTNGGLPFEVNSAEHSIFCRENEGGEWYRITAQPGEVVDVEVQYENADGSAGNMDVALVDSAGNTLRASEFQPVSDDGLEIIQYGVNPDLDGEQEYFIHVRGNVLQSKVPYRLYADVRAPEACTDDGFEPNNAIPATTSLDVDTSHEDLQVCGDDRDTYLLDVDSNQIVTVTLRAEERLGDVNVALMYDDELELPLTEVTNNATTQEYQFETTTSDDLNLVVSLLDGVGKVEYDLEWSLDANDCYDKYEQNDSCPADAELLNANSTSGSFSSTDTGLVACPDDDYYAVNLRPLDELTVTAVYDRSQGAGELQMTLFGPNDCNDIPVQTHEEEISPGVFQLTIGDANDPSQPFVAQEGGTYYVLAVPFSGLLMYYDLDVQIDPGPACDDDTYDQNGSNDTFGEAVTLTEADVIDNGPQSALSDMKVCDYNQDWYQISVSDGDLLEWEIRHDAVDGELTTTLLDSDGSTVVDTMDSQGMVSVSHTGADQTYYLKVEGANGRPVRNSYRLLTYINGNGPADPACPDVYENNDDSTAAVELTPGTQSSLLSCAGDDDWYKAFVEAGESITVTTTDGADGNVDLYLYEDSDLLNYFSRSRSSADIEELTYTSARDQFVHYRVSTASAGTPDTGYDLEVTTAAGPSCVDDGFAGNVDSDNAQSVSAPGLYGRLMKCEDTEDWFQVNLDNGELFEAYLNYDDSLAGLEVSIYSFAELSDLTDPSASGTTSVQFTPSADATYYVRVKSPTRARVGYDLLLYRDLDASGTIELDGSEGPADRVCPDDFENNDSSNTATELTPGSYGELYLCSGNSTVRDDDYYDVYVPAGATLTAEAFFAHADGNIDVQIQGNGTSSTGTTQTDNELVSLTNQSSIGESFTVEVYGVGTFEAEYTMDLALGFAGNCSDDPYDPNEQGNPATVSAGAYDLTLCEQTEDWFEFTLDAGEQAQINMELRHRLGDIDMAIYDSNSVELASSETTDNLETIDYTNSTGALATYHLAVFPKNGVFLRNDYDLWLARGGNSPTAPFCPDAYERNDDTASSYSLDFSADPQVTDAIMCSTEEDWYQVDLTGSDSYDFNVFFDHTATFDLAIAVLDGNGTPVADSTSTDIDFSANSGTSDELATFTAPSTGTYFLGVKQKGGDASIQGDYFMNFDATSAGCPEDSYESNNTAANAELLTEGAHALASCAGANTAEDDYFKFVPDSDGTLTIEVFYDETQLQLSGAVDSFSPNMTSSTNRLSYSTSVTAGSTTTMYLGNAGGSGPYFVKVTYN